MSTDVLIDEIGDDGRLHHNVPMPWAHRVIFVGAGLFVLIVPTLELHGGVWPPNALSPFFLLLILGAWSVGAPILLAGLFGEAMRWTVEEGGLLVELSSPWGRRAVRLLNAAIARFELREIEHDSGPQTWSVVIDATDGRRYESRDFGSRTVADAFRQRLIAALGWSSP